MFTDRSLLFRACLVLSLFFWLLSIQSVFYWNPSEGAHELNVQIEVDGSVDQVYNYLGNSENAKSWSVYVSSINALNAEAFKDCEAGSIRRCYVKGSQNAQFWDEEILINEKNHLRQLSIFNLNNFLLTADHLITEQRYSENEEGGCLLEFSLFFKENPSFIDQLKMHFASRIVQNIFEQNLHNIKLDIEMKANA